MLEHVIWAEQIDAGMMRLGDASIKAAALFVLALALGFALRKAGSRIQSALFGVALLGALAMPVMSYMTPWSFPLLPAPAGSLSDSLAARDVVARAPLHTQNQTHSASVGAAPRATAPDNARIPVAACLMCVWLLGAAAVLSRLAFGIGRARRLTREGTRLKTGRWTDLVAKLASEMHVRRNIRTAMHDEIAAPITWGAFRPVILLPSIARSWSARRRRLVLQHELSHIRRNDWLIQIAAHFVCALYWFNPLAWLAARRHFEERELACDEAIIALGAKRSEYAEHLVEVARAACAGNATPVGTLAAIGRSRLTWRVMSILNQNGGRGGGDALLASAVACMAAAAAFAATLQIGCTTPAAQAASSSLGHTVVSSYSFSRDGNDDIVIVTSANSLRFRVTAHGQVQIGAGRPNSIVMADDAWLALESTAGDSNRRCVISPVDDDELKFIWFVNKEPREVADQDWRWIDAALSIAADLLDINRLNEQASDLHIRASRIRRAKNAAGADRERESRGPYPDSESENEYAGLDPSEMKWMLNTIEKQLDALNVSERSRAMEARMSRKYERFAHVIAESTG